MTVRLPDFIEAAMKRLARFEGFDESPSCSVFSFHSQSTTRRDDTRRKPRDTIGAPTARLDGRRCADGLDGDGRS
jgi:hypothetical protein